LLINYGYNGPVDNLDIINKS